MERTINGKTLDDILKGLEAPFKREAFKENRYGFPYLPVELYRERLDEVVGTLNYDVTVSEPKVETVGSRPQILLTVAITLRDDAGNVVCTKSAPGGSPVILSSTTSEVVSLKNDEETAASDGYKRCCKLLGMAVKQLKALRCNVKGNTSDADGETAVELFKVMIKGAYTKIGKDGYSVPIAVEGGIDVNLVIWKDAQDKIEEHLSFSEFMRLYVPGRSMRLYGRRNTFKGRNQQSVEQIIMESPYCGGE